MQYNSNVFQGKTFIHCGLADPDPGNVPLSDVHDALNIVDEMVNLAFQNWFKIGLEFPACYLNINSQRESAAFFNILQIRSINNNFSIFDFTHFRHFDKLGTLCLATTALAVQIRTSNALALISRAECAGDIDLGNRNLQTPDFNGFLNHIFMFDISHNMLVGTDTGRENFRNIGVCKGRETPIDAAGSRCRPFCIHIAKSIDKGEDTVFVVEQHGLVVAGFDPAEGHGCAVGEAKSENGG